MKTLPKVFAELEKWEKEALISPGWKAQEIDECLEGVLKEARGIMLGHLGHYEEEK